MISNKKDEWRVSKMTNLIFFINSFLSYFLLFAFIVALVIVACVLGAKWCKSSDRKKSGGTGQPTMPDMVEAKK